MSHDIQCLIRSTSGSAQQHRALMKLERLASHFASLLCSQELLAIYQVDEVPFPRQNAWYVFRHAGEQEFALSIEGFPGRDQYYHQLLWLARQLINRDDALSPITIIEWFSRCSPLFAACFKLYQSREEGWSFAGKLYYAGPIPLQIMPQVYQGHNVTKVFLECKLNLSLEVQLCLDINNLCVKEGDVKTMENEGTECCDALNRTLPLSLCLGSISMQLGDMLQLRPGTAVSFAKPALFEGSLRIGEREWAMVEVHIDDKTVILKVKDIAGLKHNF